MELGQSGRHGQPAAIRVNMVSERGHAAVPTLLLVTVEQVVLVNRSSMKNVEHLVVSFSPPCSVSF